MMWGSAVGGGGLGLETRACDHVDCAHVRMLLDSSKPPSEALHQSERRLHVVVVPEVVRAGALALVRTPPRVEANEDCRGVEAP